MAHKRKLKLLVSGFGPFDKFGHNPSGDVAKAVDGWERFGIRVNSVILDVDWQKAWPTLKSRIDMIKPDAVLSLGLAEEPVIRLEKIARNVNISHTDIRQNLPNEKLQNQISNDGLMTYNATLPIEWLYERLQRNSRLMNLQKPGLGIRISQDAGAYLSNYVFYQCLHHYRTKVPYLGFVHVPAYSFYQNLFSDQTIVNTGRIMVNQLMIGMRYAEKRRENKQVKGRKVRARY